MKKAMIWLLAMLMLCQVICAGALAAGEDICGTWYLTGMDDGSGEDTSAMIAAMNALGMSATLEIREDGTASIDLFGDTYDFNVDFEKELFLINEEEIVYVLKDGQLIFGDEDMTMTFSSKIPSSKGSTASQPFDYYEFIDMLDADGNLSDFPSELVNLVIFSDNTAVMTAGTTTIDMFFDFENNEITSDGDEVIGTFTQERNIMTIDDGEYIIRFRPGDPGFAGPYALTGMVDSEGKDLSEEIGALSLLNMLPTLTIDENGEGVLSMMGQETALHFDFEKMVITGGEDDQSVEFAYDKGTLTMSGDGNSMTFRRVMGEAAAEEAPAEAEQAPAGDTNRE